MVSAALLAMLPAVHALRFGALAWVAMVPLLGAIAAARSWRQALGCGWLFGAVLFAVAFFWLGPATATVADVSPWLAWSIFVLTVANAGLVFGVFGVGVAIARRHFPHWPMALLAPLMLTAAEQLVPTLLAFKLGHTQGGYPGITQVVDLTGVAGLSFLLAMVNGALFDLAAAIRARSSLPWRSFARAVVVMSLALGYSHGRIAEIDRMRAQAPKLRLGIVQGNLSRQDSADPEKAAGILKRYRDKSRQLAARGAELIIWPEGAVPYVLLRELPADAPPLEQGLQFTRGLPVPLLLGAQTVSSAAPDAVGALYNSAWLIEANGRIAARYDKHLLFPLSERIPYAERFPILARWFPGRRYEPGRERNLLSLGRMRIGPLICFEDIHPDFVRELVSLNPNLLLTLSSNARFGALPASEQHHANALLRAIEMRRDLVRATENGISSIIDAAGRVRVQTRAVEPERLPGIAAFGLTGTVALLDGPTTFYARHGDVFAWINVLAALLLVAAGRALQGRSKG